MSLIDLNFEDEEEVQAPEPGQEAQIELEFQGEEGRETQPQGVSGYAEPVEQNIFEKIGDWYNQGYSAARKNIAQQKGLMFDETAEDIARTGARVKELERVEQQYSLDPTGDTVKQLHEISEADSIMDAVGLMIKYPEATASVTISSLGRFAPALAATAGVGAMTGGTTTPLMASTFMGSLSIEYGAVMDEVITESGYDSSDPRAWEKVVNDEEMLERGREKGLKRGIPIAAFDAISMGLAGKLLAGAKPTATSIVTRSTGELGQQMVMGGAGEAAAQYVDVGEIESPGEIAMEGFAEMGPGIAETLIGYQGQKQQALRRQMAEQAGAEAAQREADKALTPDFEVKPIEENETAIDEALAAAPPTPETRPDEESITEKFDLEPEEEAPAQMDLEQQSAEDEANAYVLEQLRQQFPDASEEELQAAIGVARPKTEELPTEEDLGYVEPAEEVAAEPKAPKPEKPKEEAPAWEPVETIKAEQPATAEITPKPEQPQEELPTAEPVTTPEPAETVEAAAPAEPEPEPVITPEPEEEVQEITRDEVVQATEAVEPTGEAIEAAETIRTARPEFEGTIFSFKPGDERHGEAMEHYYGEIAETEDADGMPIDVMWNKDADPAATDGPIFIIDQIDADTQEFKQHKVMGGFDEMAEAETAYMNQWGEDTLQDTTELTAEEFDTWKKTGDHKSAFGEDIATDEERAYGPAGAPPSQEEVYAEPDALTPEEEAIRAEEQRQDQISIDRQERAKKAVKEKQQLSETDDLVDFIRKSGGLNVEKQSDVPGHRLAHLNARRDIGIPNLVQKGEKGLSLADLTERAWEAGYITENDTQQMIEKLFESEQKPVYTAKGYEAQMERAQLAEDERAQQEYEDQVNQDADDMAAYIIEQSGGPRFSSEDIPDLISLAADEDYGAVLDITGDNTLSEDEVRTRLQAIIDGEQKPAEAAPAEAVPGEEEVPAGPPGLPEAAPEAAEEEAPSVEEWLSAIENRIFERNKKNKIYDNWREALERSEELHPTYYEEYRDPQLVERGFMAGYMYGIDRGAEMSASPQAGIDAAETIGLTDAGRWAPYFSDAHYLGQLAAMGHQEIEVEAAPAPEPAPAEHKWPQPNKHGVYDDADALVLEFNAVKSDKITAKIKLLQIGPDRWAIGYNFQSQQGSGAGQSSGISAHPVYTSMREAEIAGLRGAKRYGQSNTRDTSSTSTEKQRASSRKVMEWAMEQLAARGAPADIEDILFRSIEHREGFKRLDRMQLTAEAEGEKVKQSARKWVQDIDERLRRLEDLRTCA